MEKLKPELNLVNLDYQFWEQNSSATGEETARTDFHRIKWITGSFSKPLFIENFFFFFWVLIAQKTIKPIQISILRKLFKY